MNGPTFTTPDVLLSGQTGWDIDRRERVYTRKLYKHYRRVGVSRAVASRMAASRLNAVAPYSHDEDYRAGMDDWQVPNERMNGNG